VKGKEERKRKGGEGKGGGERAVPYIWKIMLAT